MRLAHCVLLPPPFLRFKIRPQSPLSKPWNVLVLNSAYQTGLKPLLFSPAFRILLSLRLKRSRTSFSQSLILPAACNCAWKLSPARYVVNPFDLRGPEFLLFYFLFACAVLGILILLRRIDERPNALKPPLDDP